jgi:uncharacterized protein YabE (DUF348 family)
MMGKLKTFVNKYFSNGPKAVPVVATVLMIVLVALFFSMRKTITVSVDGSNRNITTFRSTYAQALKDNKIKVGPEDKVKPSLNSRINNGSIISIKRAVKVQVQIDGKKLVLNSAEDNIIDMLKSENIKLNKSDIISPKGDSKLKDGMKVVVTRVQSKYVKQTTPIKYETVIRNDKDMQKGNSKVLQEGQNGEKETVTQIIYQNGKEISRKIVKEIVKKQPVQKIVAIGAMSDSLSRGGNVSYTKVIKMRATAYTADYISTGKSPGDKGFGITATGTVARRNNYSSSVAVDPRVIPLGTKLYVEGYGYAIAEDTGGAIKGNRIDLFFNSSSQANEWGVKWVNVYVAE